MKTFIICHFGPRVVIAVCKSVRSTLGPASNFHRSGRWARLVDFRFQSLCFRWFRSGIRHNKQYRLFEHREFDKVNAQFWLQQNVILPRSWRRYVQPRRFSIVNNAKIIYIVTLVAFQIFYSATTSANYDELVFARFTMEYMQYVPTGNAKYSIIVLWRGNLWCTRLWNIVSTCKCRRLFQPE